MRRGVRGGPVVLLGLALGVLTGPVPIAQAHALQSSNCDFDGDGRDDLAVGVPGDSIGGVSDAGSVLVMYGAAGGLQPAGSEQWNQDTAGVPETGEPGDQFGAALGCADFDGNGADDLAVGIPGEDVGTRRDAGAVLVLNGTPAGLVTTFSRVLTQDTTGVLEDAEARDRFGGALTAGDFDGDGRDDLAVGVVGERVGTGTDAEFEGAVNVVYGTPGGLAPPDNQLWTQDSPDVGGLAEPRDLFGSALASGDLDGDGRDDLVVGVPGEDVGTVGGSGTVNVLYGTAAGLAAAGNQLFHQDAGGVLDEAEPRDLFGTSLAVADFDGNGRDDVAVGVPGEDVGNLDSAGAVAVLYGTAAGLAAGGNDLWHQGNGGSFGGAQAGSHFGESLAAGNLDRDGRDDLAIGVPWDSLGGVTDRGAVGVLYGADTGLNVAGSQFWHQDRPGILGVTEADDHFGETLAIGDFNGNLTGDLVAGTPGEDVGGSVDGGSVSVLYGGPGTGLGSAGNQLWFQGGEGVAGDNEPFDRLSGRLRSNGTYRIGFQNGTEVRVSQDRTTHTPSDQIDMSGVDGDTVVAARGGTVMFAVDGNAEPTDDNNYVWLRHGDGEWTKYTHVAQDSLVVRVGDVVPAGAVLGTEGDVGQASGVHLHFEVARPDDVANPVDAGGFMRGYHLDPVVCGIDGQTLVAGQTYTAGDC